METINITFFGTSQAIPTASRNHTSILFSYKDENILIDCGEGTQRQFRKARINPCKTTRLFITHWHGDHVLGIPGLLQTLSMNNYSKKLYVYGPIGTKKFINEIMKIFIHRQKFEIIVIEVKKDGKFFESEDFSFESVSLDHGVPTQGYVFLEHDKRKIDKKKLEHQLKGVKIKAKELSKLDLLKKGKNIKIGGKSLSAKTLTTVKKGRKISFLFDTGVCAGLKKASKNADLVIIESTYGKDREDLAKEYKHLTSEMAAKIAKDNKVKQLILTHISQIYEGKEKLLLNEAKKIFPKVKIAEDLMKVSLS